MSVTDQLIIAPVHIISGAYKQPVLKKSKLNCRFPFSIAFPGIIRILKIYWKKTTNTLVRKGGTCSTPTCYVLVVANTVIARNTYTCSDLTVVKEGDIFHELFFRKYPPGSHGTEIAKLFSRAKTTGSIAAAGYIYKILIVILVTDPAKKSVVPVLSIVAGNRFCSRRTRCSKQFITCISGGNYCC